jgi:hypothetical protein
MVLKVFVCFNENDEIVKICADKRDCDSTEESQCEEYIMKLIPIDRGFTTDSGEYTKTLKELEQSTKRFANKMKRESKALEKSIKKFKIK